MFENLTICVKCVHHSNKSHDEADDFEWEPHFCLAHENPPGIDVVTGEEGYRLKTILIQHASQMKSMRNVEM